MEKVLNFFNGMIEKLENDFSYKNFGGDDVGIDDYQTEIIPLERVLSDKNKCLEMISDYFSTEEDANNRELVVAIYCNFYIRYGMAGRMQIEKKDEKYDGLERIFEELSVDQQYLKELYTAVKTQCYGKFDKILKINKDSIVAKMYKFVKVCHGYCQEIADKMDRNVLSVDDFEDMWILYESIPAPWDQYVLGEGEWIKKNSNHAIDHNFLPYMSMISMREILTEYIPRYYLSILDKLSIDHDIEAENVYEELMRKLGVRSIEDFVVKGIPNRFKNLSENEMVYEWVHSTPELLELFLQFIQKLNKANENMDMTFLMEKIHDLQYGEHKDWQEGDEMLDGCPFCEMYPAYRSAYLHIPVRGPVKRELFKAQYDVFLRQRDLKKLAVRKKEMMDYYAHSWKHIAYPQIVKEVAEELSKTNISLANRLMKAYHSEKTLQRSIQLLQYINSDDDKAVSRAFKEGMALADRDSEKTVALKTVIRESLDLVVFKMLMTESDDSRKMENCRHKWSQIHSMKELRERYTHDFLENSDNNKEIVTWVNENILRVDLSIDEGWDSVRFRTESFAVNQFKEILVEIFTNVFVHGEKYMRIEFASKDNCMEVVAENACSGMEAEQRKGISTMTRVLESINFDMGINSIEKSLENGIYRIALRFNKKMMIRRGR